MLPALRHPAPPSLGTCHLPRRVAVRLRSEDDEFPLFRALRAPDLSSAAKNAPGNTPPRRPTPPEGDTKRDPGSSWDTWDQWAPLDGHAEDWEPWEEEERPLGGPRKYPRRMSNEQRPRDEFLRPIVDFAGIRDRLSTDAIATEERITEEFVSNQEDSREALKFAGRLVAIPLVTGFIISRLLAVPIISSAESFSTDAFAVSDRQKVEGAREVHREELRLRMEASIGRRPALTNDELQLHLHEEALHIADEFKEKNKRAYLNVVSDSVAGTVFFIMLVRNSVQRQVLFRTISRVFSGLSDTAKAFIIIAVTDTLLGYHSEDGWTAAIRLISNHYGYEVEEGPVYLFVATVPVFLDSLFKFWIFTGLNRIDPAAAVTLKNMDRH